jgi:PAS domain S-box-containing protein
MPFAEQHIRRAIEGNKFVPYFQPLVDLRARTIHGFEILARWDHPTQGLVSPGLFIPVIERYGLMNNLTASLLSQAFATVRSLPATFGLSVNLSPSQLHDRTLPDFIHRMADEDEFDLKRLTIELTETALVDDLDLAGAVAADFKRLGIQLALDDFGIGYSSLLHLQSLPFDEIKVDASFVRSMVHSRQSRKITAAVVSLGLSLGLQTVAEGIEEQNQANLLAWQGCHLGQGHLYGMPVPAVELPGVLSQHHLGACVAAEVPASIADQFLSLEAQPTERFSQLRAIYDGAPVGLAFVNTRLRYVNLNQKLAEMNGQSVEAHLGRPVSEMVKPEVYAQFEPYLKRALNGESFPGIEVQKPSSAPGAPAATMMATHQPVRDEAGEILGVCVSITDISVVKQKEEALRDSEDHYRHTVELNRQIPDLWIPSAATSASVPVGRHSPALLRKRQRIMAGSTRSMQKLATRQ